MNLCKRVGVEGMYIYNTLRIIYIYAYVSYTHIYIYTIYIYICIYIYVQYSHYNNFTSHPGILLLQLYGLILRLEVIVSTSGDRRLTF